MNLSDWLAPVAATGIGSLPGTDVVEAAGVVFGECELPYVPELPARGPGADMVGRTMARLAHVDPAFSMTTTPSGWRLTDRPGREVRRAMSFWGEDLDAVEERATDFVGAFKVSLCGPFTLAASVELVSGEKVLRDLGARRDFGMALAEAVRALIPDLRRRLPNATVVLQLDEPSLPAVLRGAISSASGLTSLAPIEPVEVESIFVDLVSAIHALEVPVVVHSCSSAVPFELWKRAGFDAISFDATFIGESDYDHIGTAIDSGVGVLLGVVPTTKASESDTALSLVTQLQRELGFSDDQWLPAIGVSPTCGLATLSARSARSVIDTVASVSKSLRGTVVAGSSDSDRS